MRCSSLISVTIVSDTKYIGHNFLHRCTSLTSVSIPKTVEKVGDSFMFDCKSVPSVTLPESLKEVGHRFMWGCDNLVWLEYSGHFKAPSVPFGTGKLGRIIMNMGTPGTYMGVTLQGIQHFTSTVKTVFRASADLPTEIIVNIISKIIGLSWNETADILVHAKLIKF